MITSLEIRGFRGFERLLVKPLSRVNLFVGRNNAGKTSLLEALDCLFSNGWDRTWLRGPHSRGEWRWASQEHLKLVHQQLARVASLFHGFRTDPGSTFDLVAELKDPIMGSAAPLRFEAMVAVLDPRGEEVIKEPSEISLAMNPRGLVVFHPREEDEQEGPVGHVYPLNHQGEVLVDAKELTDRWESLGLEAGFMSQPVGSLHDASGGGNRNADLRAHWEPFGPRCFLSQESARVLQALWRRAEYEESTGWVIRLMRLVEPKLKRILPGADERGPRGSSFLIELEGSGGLLPLGAMGEGAGRLLGIALALVATREGVLLVDEIDTGLHHTVMSELWSLVVEAAHALKIQVFATSHSSDCWRALGRLSDEDPKVRDSIAVHRLEAGLDETVRYSPEELSTAAEADIEIR